MGVIWNDSVCNFLHKSSSNPYDTARSHVSMYHALGCSSLKFAQALMTNEEVRLSSFQVLCDITGCLLIARKLSQLPSTVQRIR